MNKSKASNSPVTMDSMIMIFVPWQDGRTGQKCTEWEARCRLWQMGPSWAMALPDNCRRLLIYHWPWVFPYNFRCTAESTAHMLELSVEIGHHQAIYPSATLLWWAIRGMPASYNKSQLCKWVRRHSCYTMVSLSPSGFYNYMEKVCT